MIGYYILFIISGFVIGYLISRCDGLFIIDDSDENVTKWIIRGVDPEKITKKKTLVLKVKKIDA